MKEAGQGSPPLGPRAFWLCAVCGDLGKPDVPSKQAWGCASTEFGDPHLHTQHRDPKESRSCASYDVVNRSRNQTPKQRTPVSKAGEGKETPANKSSRQGSA